jgi:hypothetical protein
LPHRRDASANIAAIASPAACLSPALLMAFGVAPLRTVMRFDPEALIA